MKRIRGGLIGVLAAAMLPAIAAAAPASATVTPWHVGSYLSRLGTENDRISCASTSACWAIEGGLLLSSSDGGANWSDQTGLVPSDAAELTDVSCPTDIQCYLAGVLGTGAPVVYAIASGTLTATAATGATAILPTIDCPDTLSCFTTDGTTFYATADGGASWTPQPLGQPVERRIQLSCVNQSVSCGLIGVHGSNDVVLAYTADSGQSWQTDTIASPLGGPDATISCSTPLTCNALFTTDSGSVPDSYRTVDGGASWQLSQYSPEGTDSISCGSEKVCVAVGHTGWTWRTVNGMRWYQEYPGAISVPSGPDDVSCPTLLHCTAVADSQAGRTDDEAVTWTRVVVPSAIHEPAYLDCRTVTACLGLEFAGGFRSVAGPPAGPWTTSALPDGIGELHDLDCPAVRTCYAGSTSFTLDAQVVSTVNGGQTWAAKVMAHSPDDQLDQVSCPSVTVCLASPRRQYSTHLHVTDTGGTSWRSVAAPSGTTWDAATACSTPTACVLLTVGNGYWTTDDLGATWTPATLTGTPALALDADCSSTLCVAVGRGTPSATSLALSTDTGASWTAVAGPASARDLRHVSCGSATACAATGVKDSGDPVIVGTTNAGTTWHVRTLPISGAIPTDVTCVRATCFASGTDDFGRPVILTGSA